MGPISIPARQGAYARLLPGQTIKLINTHGTQVIDFWAFTPPPTLASSQHLSEDTSMVPRSFVRSNDSSNMEPSPPKRKYPISEIQYLSMSRTRSVLMKLIPSASAADVLYTNKSLPLLTLVADTTQHGIHDTLFGCCDRFRYHNLSTLGFPLPADYSHASCAENLHVQLRESGLAEYISDEWTPDPLNVFMNVPVEQVSGEGRAEGRMSSVKPTSRAGESVTLRAEREVWCFMSACPNDIIEGVNAGRCMGVEFEVGLVGQAS